MLPPVRAPKGSSLLRLYNIAAALPSLGSLTVELPWKLSLSQRQAMLTPIYLNVVVVQGVRHELSSHALYPSHQIADNLVAAEFQLPHLAGPVRRAMGKMDAVIARSALIDD